MKRRLFQQQIMRIRAFIQKLSWNVRIVCTKIQEKKNFKKLFEKVTSRTSQKPSLESLYEISKPFDLSVSWRLSEKKDRF